MNSQSVPFSPLPPKAMIGVASHFRWLGSRVSGAFPFLRKELKYVGIEIDPDTYGAIMAVMFFAYFVLGAVVVYAFAQRLVPESAVPASIILGFVFGFLVFIQVLLYPKILLKKRMRDLERNLVFALRTILVEIKSGVSLFDSISIVAHGDNGEVSRQFKKAVEQIETGTFQNEALEEMAENNPSLYFRRAIWQLVNGLKAGSDISNVMTALVDNLSKEKANQIRGYGNSLRLLSLLYMMLGAIIPALGLTFLIILSSFPQIQITEDVFWGMLGFIAVSQFMYLGIIKSSRPTLLGD